MAFVRLTTRAQADALVTRLTSEINNFNTEHGYVPGDDRYFDPIRLVPRAETLFAQINNPNSFAFADTTEPRIIVMLHREGSGANRMWWVDQVWGPSAIHDKILLRLCNEAVSRGLGAEPVSYRRDLVHPMPLTLMADAKFTTPAQISADGSRATTTFSAAAAQGVASGVTP